MTTTFSDNPQTRESAAQAGFGVFNNGPHLCVEVPAGNFTISARTPNGHRVTFAFCPRPDGAGHQCVDVRHESGEFMPDGQTHKQRIVVFGQGPTIARTTYSDEPAATHRPTTTI